MPGASDRARALSVRASQQVKRDNRAIERSRDACQCPCSLDQERDENRVTVFSQFSIVRTARQRRSRRRDCVDTFESSSIRRRRRSRLGGPVYERTKITL